MDLKSVALDLEEETMPLLPDGHLASKSNGGDSQLKAEPASPVLTPSAGQHTTAAVAEETTMADEIETIDNTDAPAVAETSTAPVKQRKPRAKRAAAPVDAAAEAALASTAVAGKQKRGRKLKSSKEAGPAKRAPVTRASRAVQPEPAMPAVSSDEMADIVQLEEENQRLRKLLAEKLRAENADLRKRLKLD